MCGIAGIINYTSPVETHRLQAMLDCLRHRGPDDEGIWFSRDQKVGLGQRRLAIIDLSPGGHQPMISEDGQYTLTFNGEIYNYQSIREELKGKGWKFTTVSDVEVLLKAYQEWGQDCLTRLNGMFAFAVWDEKTQTLFAARDHVGEKPFKYYHGQTGFIFASEVKAILTDKRVPRELDWQAIDVALGFRYVPAPQTGFLAVKKLPAGHYLVLKNNELTIKQYWFPENIITDDSKSFTQWKKQSWELFVDSVKKRLVSDVPLGAFLSGGIDSTSVVAAVREITSQPFDTFVVSLGGQSEDQKYAAVAAKYFSTTHHTIAFPTIDYQSVIEEVVKQYDEPFFDQSALPSLLIAKEMKKHVTVVLSGDGGDELFGGYQAYQQVGAFGRYAHLPTGLRKVIPRLMPQVSLAYKTEIMSGDFFNTYTEYYNLWKTHLPVTHKYFTKDDLYLPEVRQQIDLSRSRALMQGWFASKSTDQLNNAMLADIKGRLADGYLTKVDLATMASAVESRSPFIDKRLVEHALQMPSKYKIRGTEGKYIWKQIVENKIPTEIIKRPKAGFSIPLHRIIKEDMRSLVEGTILSNQSVLSNYFSTEMIRKMWTDHDRGKADYSNHLWSLLTLELWLRHYLGK